MLCYSSLSPRHVDGVLSVNIYSISTINNHHIVSRGGYDAHSYSVPWRGKGAKEHAICITYAFLSCGVKNGDSGHAYALHSHFEVYLC
jgi:hypothetical protein